MARINGVNSDYRFKSGAIEEVDPMPTPLELKLFICPTKQKNSLEAETNVCVGQNTTCPAPAAQRKGHALLRLHEQDGLQLVTDGNNRLHLDQSGNIHLLPSSGGKIEMIGNVELKNRNGNTLLNVADSVMLSINGARIVLQSDGGILIEPAAARGLILRGNGATIELASNGNITLSPPVSGKVTINGNLEVSGTINDKVF